MMVKSTDGKDVSVTRLGQGIYNTVGASAGIAALLGANNGNGILGGLLGGGSTYVDEKTFYNQQIADVREMYTNLMDVNQRICNVESRLSGDEIAIEKNFEIEGIRSNYEQQLMKAYIDAKCCKFVEGDVFLSPSHLADPYLGRQNVIATYTPTGYCGWNTFDCNCGF
jgi:hypothetical protein